jgi:cellulose synthase/poly-beta-1,6-N-acetylglucosamine synthase-like glycosyltransferase
VGAKVSIVIAVKNEENNLPRVIPTLVKQHYPVKDFEIIFIDGKSKDNTREIIKEWKKKSKVKITLLDNPHKDSGSGRNIGINAAKGKYIMQLSGHTLVDNNLLKVLVTKLDKQPEEVAGVGCRHKDPADSTSFQKAVGKILYSKVGGVGTSQQQGTDDIFVDSVSFTCYRKKALLDVGLNDSKFKIGQDAELNIRLRKKGYKLLYTPQTYVEQYKRPSYTGLAKQMFWYGYSRHKMLRKHPRQFKLLYLAPSALILFFIASLILIQFTTWAKQILFVGGLAYSAPIIYSCTKLGEDTNEGAVMFIGYLVVHFSYGLGFLFGII